MEKRVIDIKEFIKMTGISRAHAYNLAKAGKIKTLKLGRRILIPVSEVEALLR